MITIKRADNGWILEVADASTKVFAFDDSMEGDEHRAASELLGAVTFELGVEDSRYSKHRIYIEVRPGDKYEG